VPSSVDSTKIGMGEVVDCVAFLPTVGDIGFGVKRIFVEETMSYSFDDGNIGPIILPTRDDKSERRPPGRHDHDDRAA